MRCASVPAVGWRLAEPLDDRAQLRLGRRRRSLSNVPQLDLSAGISAFLSHLPFRWLEEIVLRAHGRFDVCDGDAASVGLGRLGGLAH